MDASRCDSDVFLKLVSVSNTRAFPVRVCFIPAYSKFTFQGVAQGNYDVRYRDLSSGLLYKTEEFTLQEITKSDGIEYHDMTMTLYPVAYGNMHTEPIDEFEFF